MKIAVLFGEDMVNGKINAVNGTIKKISALAPDGITDGKNFQLPSGGKLEIEMDTFTLKRGALPTIINILTEKNPFSFFLRDVNAETPIFFPEFKAAVVPPEEPRTYSEISDAVNSKMLVSDFSRFENEPEESYKNAGENNRDQYCPTWLGLGRDMRIFRIGYQERYGYWGQIQPCNHSVPRNFIDIEKYYQLNEELAKSFYQINFEIGHGASCRPNISRWLEDGVLPVLHSKQVEQDIHYNITAFASLENEPLSRENVRGSDWRACYMNTGGNMTTPKDHEELKDLLKAEIYEREQEVICCLRVEAVNLGRIPRYAWFKCGHVTGFKCQPLKIPGKHYFANGFSCFDVSKKVYAINLIDRKAAEEEEIAILLQPGGKVIFDLIIPHCPITQERANNLTKFDFDAHLKACIDFWKNKLASATQIYIPEKEINESVKAGLLHCDLATLGLEPEGVALATVGWYSPIGTESSPIIQFFDSVGWHKLAERTIQFFFERQYESGFVQNFARYESETGPFLWTVGEHFRYTKDIEWLKRIMPNIKKAVKYLLDWRSRNKKDEYRAKGFYGMIDGKVADPDDYYHAFFLNAGTYVGLKRIGEISREIEPEYANELAKEVKEYQQDIIDGFYYAQKNAPLIPLGDGSWAALMPPWVEYAGGINLYADGGNCFTHGSFASRGTLVGAMWLIIFEVLDPNEIGSDFLIKTNQYPQTLENAALSQPYYSRHDFAHIKRNEVKAFLKTYYNQLTAIQDRETHTFWEHYYHASEHKTHEEGWFLMQTRWMLYLEEGDTLTMLKAIPRRWLEDGKKIALSGVKSYFGPVRFKAESDLKNNLIKAEIKLEVGRFPAKVAIRLPHPKGLKAVACEGGSYDPATETVTIANFKGKASVILKF